MRLPEMLRREQDAPVPPLTRSVFGWHCFVCGKPTWLHRKERKQR